MNFHFARPDMSTAETMEEFIAVLRRAWSDYDPAKITNPAETDMKIQYESIRADRTQIAEDLERLWNKLKVSGERPYRGK